MTETLVWWCFLATVAAANVAAWTLSVRSLGRRRGRLDRDTFLAQRWQLILSAGYVFGCAYRSAVPVFDVPRITLVDDWLGSVVVGRSVATVAELCFVTQWALMLRLAARSTGSDVGVLVSGLIVPAIAFAETCSWYAVLTTSNLGHVVEESIWGLCAALLVLSLVAIWPRTEARRRPMLAAWCAVGVGYVAYMFLVDVPMYWSRWLADEAGGRAYLSVAQGFADVSERWNVSHSWDIWRGEAVWMSLYFSVAVWLSIALVHMPVPKPAPSTSRALHAAAS